jgi:S-methylmethionine-dependent homocysteine/selenocysteine methylase
MMASLAERIALAGLAPLLLDAAMGTELTRRGADTSPPLWSARALTQAPHLVLEIHREAVLAGADILTATTFRTHPRTLTASGLSPVVARDQSRDLARKAVDLARTACQAAPDRQVWVAGSLAPLEDCYRPDLVPHDFDLAREHGAQAIHLAEAGADFILIETMNSSREARAAHRAVIQTGLPAMVSFVTDGQGSLLSGESLAAAARALLEDLPAPLAIGVNCIPARLIAGELARLHAALEGFPLLAYGNTGRPLDERAAAYTDPLGPSEYAEVARCWLNCGTRVAGSCCGTDASHTAALRRLFEKEIVDEAPSGSSRR